MTAQIAAERDFRRPGCGNSCTVIRALIPGVFGRSELLVHDPDDHETYGRAQVRTVVRLGHEIESGPLMVDIARGEARLTGQPLLLTPIEWRLLTTLSRRIGLLIEYDEIISAVWGAAWVTTRVSALHSVRIAVSRLRAKLGDAAGLLVTVPYLGMRLDPLPAEQLPEPWPVHYRRTGGQRLPPGQWSRGYPACLGCGTTEVAYARRGYCRRWRCIQQANKIRDAVRAAARAGQSVATPAPPLPLAPPPPKPWARKYAACITCGTTERNHNSHGRCSRCHHRHQRRQARVAGGAP